MILSRAGRSSLSAAIRASRLASPYRHISPPPLRHYPILPPPFAASPLRHICYRWKPSVSHEDHWGIVIVRKQEAFIIERLGEYLKTLEFGIHLLIPFVDRIAYVHSLKEEAFSISNESATTKDGIEISIDSMVSLKIVDPKLASYCVGDPIDAVIESMRSELRKITLDMIFQERNTLNENIMLTANDFVNDMGFECLHYEIKYVSHPRDRTAMELLASVGCKTILGGESKATLTGVQAKVEGADSIKVDLSTQGVKVSIQASSGIGNMTVTFNGWRDNSRPRESPKWNPNILSRSGENVSLNRANNSNGSIGPGRAYIGSRENLD